MAKELVFLFGGNNHALEPIKLERKKLYGWTETVALDKDGHECSLDAIDTSGSHIIPKGGSSLGTLDSEGAWVEKSELTAVLSDGSAAPLVAEVFTESSRHALA